MIYEYVSRVVCLLLGTHSKFRGADTEIRRMHWVLVTASQELHAHQVYPRATSIIDAS